MEDEELYEIFEAFCENMGLEPASVDLSMLDDPEFYVAAFKHLFPTFEVSVNDHPIQQVIDVLES
jgi:hypothetical protein